MSVSGEKLRKSIINKHHHVKTKTSEICVIVKLIYLPPLKSNFTFGSDHSMLLD